MPRLPRLYSNLHIVVSGSWSSLTCFSEKHGRKCFSSSPLIMFILIAITLLLVFVRNALDGATHSNVDLLWTTLVFNFVFKLNEKYCNSQWLFLNLCMLYLSGVSNGPQNTDKYWLFSRLLGELESKKGALNHAPHLWQIVIFYLGLGVDKK